jgi:hypothetical protein
MIFRPQAAVIPYGIFLPQWDELFLLHPLKVTSDFMVDVLEDWWVGSSAAWFSAVQRRYYSTRIMVGKSFRRTQFMKRMLDFAERHQVNLRLAYYPPYHDTIR